MDEMLKNVKSIEMDGLLWGASKLIPIGYGIKKLQVGETLIWAGSLASISTKNYF